MAPVPVTGEAKDEARGEAQGEARTGLLLFAHGARDSRWAEPFLAIRAAVQDTRPEMPVELAFLELMQPDLTSAVATLIESGCSQIRVVPLFLGEGAHLRRDLPALIEAEQRLHPQVSLLVSRLLVNPKPCLPLWLTIVWPRSVLVADHPRN